MDQWCLATASVGICADAILLGTKPLLNITPHLGGQFQRPNVTPEGVIYEGFTLCEIFEIPMKYFETTAATVQKLV